MGQVAVLGTQAFTYKLLVFAAPPINKLHFSTLSMKPKHRSFSSDQKHDPHPPLMCFSPHYGPVSPRCNPL